MPDPSDFELPLPVPKSEYLFEDMMLDLYKRVWGDRDAQRNGRRGQEQKGVDIFGRPSWLNGKYAGAQCKRYYATKLTIADVRKEVAKADEFQPELGEFVIVTTNSTNATLQEEVRLLNEERGQQSKISVRIEFWEDLHKLLTQEANYDILREYYKGWAKVFAPEASTATEILQLMRERADFEKLANRASENYFRVELTRLRSLFNGGYTEVANDAIAVLVEQLEAVPTTATISNELKGDIYCLAAHASFPVRNDGDATKARSCLVRARSFLTTDEGVKRCEVIEAFIDYREYARNRPSSDVVQGPSKTHDGITASSSGKDLAITRLSRIEHPDADRVRFYIYLEEDQLDECARILAHLSRGQESSQQKDGLMDASTGPNDLLQTTEWMRPLVLYYARVGDVDQVENITEKMTELGMAADYSTAAQALNQLAYKPFQEFCEAHDISPETHYTPTLQLHGLVNEAMLLQGAELYERAADAYDQHSCPNQAVEALIAAIRLHSDRRGAEPPARLWRKLEKLDPNNAFLSGRTARSGQPNDIAYDGNDADAPDTLPTWNHIGTMFQQNIDASEILLGLEMERGSYTPTLARSLFEALKRFETQFMTDAGVAVRYLRMQYNLCQVVGDDKATAAWLEQIEPPVKYGHCVNIFRIMFYTGRDEEKAAGEVLAAERDYPNHPEVLEVLRGYYEAQRHVENELRVARQLFALRRCNTTAINVLDPLVALARFQEAEEFLNEFEELLAARDEEIIHRVRSFLYSSKHEHGKAQEHLEWLRRAGKSTLDDLLNLATAYHFTGQPEHAVPVLKEAVKLYPNKPQGYIGLAQIYLHGKNYAERFRWARKAYRRFPDDISAAFILVEAGLSHGNRTDAEVAEAFQAFLPGGRFADSGVMKMVPADEGMEMLRKRMNWSRSVHALYQQGAASIMLICYIQDQPLFRAHQTGIDFREHRYAGTADTPFDLAAEVVKPKNVVLDYSALLTLWSLFGEKWRQVLREEFGGVWVSSRLQSLLAWEHDKLASYGQRDVQEAKVAVQNVINHRDEQIVKLKQVNPADGADLIGEYTEAATAGDKGIPYLSEHHSKNAQLETDVTPAPTMGESTNNSSKLVTTSNALGVSDVGALSVPVLGLRGVITTMASHGRLTQSHVGELLEHTHPTTDEELPILEGLKPKSSIVIAISTLESIALHGDLNEFCEYFGDIYVSIAGWRRLQAEVQEFQRLDNMAPMLQQLRVQLSEAIAEGSIQIGGASKREQAIPHGDKDPEKETSEVPESSENSENQGQNTAHTTIKNHTGYLNDMLALAREHDAALWTDDRWLRKLPAVLPTKWRPRDVFSTEAVLYWRRMRSGNWEQYRNSYEHLIRWRYLGLPLNADYLFSLVEQGYDPSTGALGDTIQLYVADILQYSEVADPEKRISPKFRAALHQSYGQGLAILLIKCYRAGIAVDKVAAVFKALDLARCDPTFLGKEHLYYSTLWASAIAGRGKAILRRTLPSGKDAVRDGLEFIVWLSDVARVSGVNETTLRVAKNDLSRLMRPAKQAYPGATNIVGIATGNSPHKGRVQHTLGKPGPNPRNKPCPCGSGHKYKNCHGR